MGEQNSLVQVIAFTIFDIYTECSLYENSDVYQETQCGKLCKSQTSCCYFTATDSDRCGMCMVSGFDPTNTGLTVSDHTVRDDAVVYDTGRKFRNIPVYEIITSVLNFDGATSTCAADGELISLSSQLLCVCA